MFPALLLAAPLAFSEVGTPPPFTGDFVGELSAFEEEDRRNPPADGSVLFLGSSSIYRWDGLEHAFPARVVDPALVVKRGILGAHVTDFDDEAVVARLIAPYHWRHIVFYAGDNDIGEDRLTPEDLRDHFLSFVRRVRAALPRAPITFLAIKPAPSRWDSHWRQIEDANCLVQRMIKADPTLTYVDAMTPLLEHPTPGPVDRLGCVETIGQPIVPDFDVDELHLSREGYRRWEELIEPFLLGDLRGKQAPQP